MSIEKELRNKVFKIMLSKIEGIEEALDYSMEEFNFIKNIILEECEYSECNEENNEKK